MEKPPNHFRSIGLKTEGYVPGNIEAVPLSVNARFKFANIPDYIRHQIGEAEAAL